MPRARQLSAKAMYDPSTYWRDAHGRDDLSAVGQLGRSADWNHWLYRAWLTTGRRFLERHDVTARRVCDVGAGRGSWFRLWRAIGAESITATDLDSAAVARLHGRADRTVVADISAAGAIDELGRFDLVAAMYVLLHITDDVAFRRACANLARLVDDGGHLLLAEPIGASESRRAAHAVVRPLEAYSFDGLQLVAMEAATVIGGQPLSGGLLPRAAFGLLSRAGSSAPQLLGPAVSRIDSWLVGHTAWAPSAKLALYRK